jgi:PEP-CTERM motif
MRTWKFLTVASIVSAAVLALGVTVAKADGFLPVVQPYGGFNDSPFKSMSFTSFTLVSMTSLGVSSGTPFNGLVPGVTTNPGTEVIGPGVAVDSVGGNGNDGSSLFYFDGSTGITFTFDRNVLGSLPTAAGIAWTDGYVPIRFSATDALGNSLGEVDNSACCDFSSGDGNPANYRFFGVTDSAGISSISISNNGGGIEVDDLQFGVLAPSSAVPEPSSMTLTLLGAGFLLAAIRRRFSLVS